MLESFAMFSYIHLRCVVLLNLQIVRNLKVVESKSIVVQLCLVLQPAMPGLFGSSKCLGLGWEAVDQTLGTRTSSWLKKVIFYLRFDDTYRLLVHGFLDGLKCIKNKSMARRTSRLDGEFKG